jgi:hypothetical protein
MVDRQGDEFRRLGLPFRGLFGRPLHGIDCQGLFCELDKYCREAVPELTSARSRIKAKYTGSAEGIALFFPPRWGLRVADTVPPLPQGSGALLRRPAAAARRQRLPMADLFEEGLHSRD